ncbi:hypothetical protein FMUND_15304 [Fusarium mundagurra]|uniref:Uncharacterized protein n=1 Tax=Fusarium mundagurra TaxID=1567541 RepID=A0A8H5XQ70_9HYPO|nr:hypothetical protein FMUND_15304 [Fusarium mundagurra]
MATIIGVITGALSLLSFAPSMFPGHTGSNATVRLCAGLDGTSGAQGPLSGASGSIYWVKNYDNNQKFLGETGSGSRSGGKIPNGGFSDFQIGSGGGKQPVFIQIHGGADPVCLAYALITWPDEKKYRWNGGWGRSCGLNWYYSGIYVDGDETTDCTWITRTTTFKLDMLLIRWPSFSSKENPNYSKDTGSYCKYPALRAYTHDGSSIFKRDETNPEEDVVVTRLVISPFANHTVSDACNDVNFWGPDFVSLAEGLHCDTDTHTVTPLCSDTVTSECFSLDSREKLSRRGLPTYAKNYTATIRWK